MRKIRGQRQPDRPVVLMKRDIEMFTLVGLTRYMDTNQLAREFFYNKSLDACRKRLRKLYDAGYINITLAGSQQPNLISLTGKSLSIVKQKYPELANRIRLPGSLRIGGLRHHLATVDARLYIKNLCEKQGLSLLRWANSNGDVGRDIGLDKLRLKPDGLAEIQTPEGVLIQGVEVDTGTESLKVIGNKLYRYAEAFSEGFLSELWFVALFGKRRQGAIARQAMKRRLGDKVRIIEHEHIIARPVLKPPKAVALRAWGRKTPKDLQGGSSNSLLYHGHGDVRFSAETTAEKRAETTGISNRRIKS